jgi:hypothetical protein
MNPGLNGLKIEDAVKAGQLDDILARIDAEYANYKQTPVFTCQEEELAYWSRNASADSIETPSDSATNSAIEKPGR